MKHFLGDLFMKFRNTALSLFVGLAISSSAFAETGEIKHALLISVDGMHALDVERYIANHPNSAFAKLASHGTTYTNARTPANSDSFPGLLALVTGGSPVTHGVFYDVSYDRTYFDPSNKTCAGTPGNWTAYDETIDSYTGVVSNNVIDPTTLPRRVDASGKCVPVYPHDALKTNTIFEVIKAAGGRTAWADKHPAYDLVNGPSGKGVDDLYTPEITNAPPSGTGFDATVSVICTAQNDNLKVKAIINEIDGFTHDRQKRVGVPAVFGMNFQAVSVGQKLAHDNIDGSCPQSTLTGKAGGYLDGAGTPTEVLEYGLEQTDAALQSMIDELNKQGIYDSTLFVVTAKHGQSPINPAKVNKVGHFADVVAGLNSTSDAAAQIDIVNNCSTGPCGFINDDDIALIWLSDQTKTQEVAQFLNENAQALFIDEVIAGDELKLKFNDPATDSCTPDIIVQPQYGTIYTKPSKNKNAEHGGFSFADTNVGLIVSNPRFDAKVVKTPVLSSSVAPTILKALGIDPQELNSVQVEHTPVLPGLSH